jgi:hypothetical protein
MYSGDGRAVVRATAINAPRNAMLAVDMQVLKLLVYEALSS